VIDLDASLVQAAQSPVHHARRAAHPGSHQGDLGALRADVEGNAQRLERLAGGLLERVRAHDEHHERAAQVDQVEVDTLICHGLQHGLPARPQITRAAQVHVDLREAGHMRYGRDHAGLLKGPPGRHGCEEGAVVSREGALHPHRHAVLFGQVHGPRMHHLGALHGQLAHLLEVHLVEHPSLVADSRVGREHSRDVGVYLDERGP